MFNRILAFMKKWFPIVLLFLSHLIFAQPKLKKIDAQILQADAFIGYDNFGCRYYIENNIFNKENDEKVLQYKNVALGKIAKTDIQNPLKLVLFYESFNTVVMLDNQLNETQKVKFSENAVPLVATAVGMASQNRLWIYNSLSQKIGLFDYLKNDYIEITTPLTARIIHYESDFNYFYWIDDADNRFACDVYGKVSAYGKFDNCDHFKIVDDQWILFSKSDSLYALEVKSDKKYLLQIDEKTFKSFDCKAQILSIFTKEGITNYKITLP